MKKITTNINHTTYYYIITFDTKLMRYSIDTQISPLQIFNQLSIVLG